MMPNCLSARALPTDCGTLCARVVRVRLPNVRKKENLLYFEATDCWEIGGQSLATPLHSVSPHIRHKLELERRAGANFERRKWISFLHLVHLAIRIQMLTRGNGT